jgi:hypothetical protein
LADNSIHLSEKSWRREWKAHSPGAAGVEFVRGARFIRIRLGIAVKGSDGQS